MMGRAAFQERRFNAAMIALAAFALCAGPAAAADSLSTSMAEGYARILFTADPAVKGSASLEAGVLTIHFPRKLDINVSDIQKGLAPYITAVREDTDGKTLRIAMAHPVRLHSSTSANKYAVDLVPAAYKGLPPDLPPPPPPAPKAVDVAKLPPLKVRTGSYPKFTRVVFDWPRNVPYAVFPGAGHITIRFEAQARPDLSALVRSAPPWVKDASWKVENKGTVIDLRTDADSGYHDFRDGTHIVLDVMAPHTDADAYSPPQDNGKAGPKTKFTKLADVAKSTKNSSLTISKAQAEAVVDTAKALNADTQTAQPDTDTKDADKPADKTADTTNTKTDSDAAKAAAAPKAPDATGPDARTTKQGAIISFPGAGARPAAVFVRGMTAWIVLDGAPAIDTAQLKTALGDFSTDIAASSGDGATILRIGLKSQQEIAARAEGTALKVVMAAHVTDTPTAIGFTRNNDDAKTASLTTLIPGAKHVVTAVDPDAGDTLNIVPARAGRAVIEGRTYLEFAVLQSAAGLVLRPYVDDLNVVVANSRIRISRPGGLSMTPPLAPSAKSPAALAQAGEGPGYLDFASWSRTDGKSFRAMQHILNEHIAALKPQEANPARLSLARFYLANGFAAETLGLLNLMQASDPALQGDAQLQTMRAAADYMAGRYRDAHNDIAGAQFDNDRHDSFWRGLIDAKLEDWKSARAALERAEPVLRLYPAAWQARAQLAIADAALAHGALEAADAALGKLPKNLSKPLMLDAQLSRARLYAAEGRYHDATRLFDAVEHSGYEPAAARAIYDRVTTGLTAGAITPDAAINTLEKLRYRWRGDRLELKTLRKLGELYFGQKKWRDGLQVLRVASLNFPNDDLARDAQDDMRNAFSDLFLKGKADKMPPITALALFYDFIELTPIGNKGDEMIRRMADRLVAVDLLGPAAQLLDYQIKNRLDGVARAQVATRLAMIDLLNHKPKDALAAIRTTRISGTPDDINHQRMLLEARALAALKQWNQALEIIAVDESGETQRLRADIYWESGNWAVAGQKAEALLADRWSDDKPLDADERQNVMRAAIAYSLANDETSLDRLRDHFSAKMNTSVDASAFKVVTQNIDTQGVAFRDMAGKIASIDTLESFMKDFKKSYDVAEATN